MSEDISKYFIPASGLAFGIVAFLWIFFIVWLERLGRSVISLRNARKATTDLDGIVPSLREFRLALEDARRTGSTLAETPEGVFGTALAKLGLSPEDPIVLHLFSIFKAGTAESRLEIPELLRHTEKSLLRRDSALRMCLNLFVIVGLFGTLLGLADTLGALRGGKDVEAIRDALGPLLVKLGTAFAPALWGVGFSVLGGLSYAAYHMFAIGPLFAELRRATIDRWVPALYPTVGQLATEAAQKSLKAAADVAEFAKNIHDETEELKNSIEDSSEAAKAFALAMHRFNRALGSSDELVQNSVRLLGSEIDKFSASISRWSAFEGEIKRFYDNTASAHQAQKDAVLAISNLLREHQSSMKEMKEDWVKEAKANSGQIGRAMLLLQETTKKLPERFEAVASRAETLITALHTSVEKIGNDLTAALYVQTQELKDQHVKLLGEAYEKSESLLKTHEAEIKAVLDAMDKVEGRIANLREPFEQSAENLVELARNFKSYAESHLADLPQRLKDQTDAISKVVEQTAHLEAKLTAIETSSAAIASDAASLTHLKNVDVQSGAALSLLTSVEEKLRNIGEALASIQSGPMSLTDVAKAIKELQDTLGPALDMRLQPRQNGPSQFELGDDGSSAEARSYGREPHSGRSDSDGQAGVSDDGR